VPAPDLGDDPSVAGIDWSICVRHGDSGRPGVEDDDLTESADRRLRTASVGKIVLLVEVARRIELDPAYGERDLRRDSVEPIADSGLLQHLRVEQLTIEDLAVLVGSVSDNWATNILLREVGLAAVTETGQRIGLQETVLLDRVRRPRTAQDPPALSYGTAGELCRLMADLRRGEVISPGVSGRVVRWLGTSLDLSMVASAFGLDLLAHNEIDRGYRVVNKTGTDAGIRADVGFIDGPGGHLAYAVIANWVPDGPDRRDEVLARMRAIGADLRVAVDR
jgi:beta-lactamase class A